MTHTIKTDGPLRVAVVGVGYFGRLHALKYHGLADVALIGVADKNENRAREVGAEFNVPAFTAAEELLGKVDAISIATPATTHYALARAFLNAGAHVLVEKPLAGSLAEADQLIALARRNNLVLQVGHQERFVFARFDAAMLAGKPKDITCRRAGPYTGRGLDCNVVLDLMIHDIDLAHKLIDFKARVIRATGRAVHGNLEDEVEAEIDCGEGRRLHLFASRIGDHLERFIKIEAEDRRLEIDFTHRVFRFEQHNGSPTRLGTDDAAAVPVVEIGHQDPLGEEITAFARSTRGGPPPLVSGEDGRKALATALLINEALKRQG
jgi:predicted dehydrogenase